MFQYIPVHLTRQKQSRTTACYEFYHLDSCSRQLFSDSPSGLFLCPWLWRKVVPNSFLNPTALAVPLALFYLLFKRPLLSHILPFLHLLLAFKWEGSSLCQSTLLLKATSFTKPVPWCLCLATLQSGFHSQSAFGTPLKYMVSYLYNEVCFSSTTPETNDHHFPNEASSSCGCNVLIFLLPLWEFLLHSKKQNQSLRSSNKKWLQRYGRKNKN